MTGLKVASSHSTTANTDLTAFFWLSQCPHKVAVWYGHPKSRPVWCSHYFYDQVWPWPRLRLVSTQTGSDYGTTRPGHAKWHEVLLVDGGLRFWLTCFICFCSPKIFWQVAIQVDCYKTYNGIYDLFPCGGRAPMVRAPLILKRKCDQTRYSTSVLK